MIYLSSKYNNHNFKKTIMKLKNFTPNLLTVLFALMLFSTPIGVAAQSNKKTEKWSKEREEVKKLIKLAQSATKPEIAERYEKQMLAIAKKTKDKDFEALVKGAVLNLVMSSGQPSRTIEIGEELIDYYEKRKNNTELVGNLSNTAVFGYASIGNFDKAVQLLERAISTECTDTLGLMFLTNAHNNLIDLYMVTGKQEKAMQTLNALLSLGKKHNNSFILSSGYALMTQMYFNYQLYEEGLKMLYLQEKYLNHLKFDERNEKGLLISHYKNKSDIHLALHQQDSALFFAEKALKIIDDEMYKMDIKRQRAKVLLEMGQYEKALADFLPVLDFYAADDYENTRLGLYVGKTYNCMKQYDKARPLLSNGYEKAIRYGLLVERHLALESLIELEKEEGNAEKALAYFKEYKALSDSLNNVQNHARLDFLRLDIEMDESAKAKAKEIKIKQLELKQINLQRNVLIAAIIVVLLFLWYFRKRNQLLQQNLTIKERIAAQTEELQRLYHQQNRMFANIAHELRTPLTLIAAPVNAALRQINSTSPIREQLVTAKRNVNYLQQMINQILDLSKVQTGGLSVKAISFNLFDLFESLKNDFDSLAQFQKVDFSCNTPVGRNIHLVTDGERLFTVLKNLLSNAFKYTPSNGKISVSAVELGEMLQIVVTDSGTGISKNDLPYIFNRFFQTKDKEKLVEGGTGIGLAICKEYVELLQGTIQVSSEEGEGTTFILTIPKVLANVSVSTDENISFLQNKEEQLPLIIPILETVNTVKDDLPHLLIVEDNIEICSYLSNVLKDKYNITFENNGAEALERLTTFEPDLIITDLMMPIMNGFQLIEKVKSDDKLRQIPIIVLSALNDTSEKLKALRIGVDDYLLKPFNEEELQLKVSYLIQQKQNRISFSKELLADTADLVEGEVHQEYILKREDKEWLEVLETKTKAKIMDGGFGVGVLCEELAISYSQLYLKTKLFIGITPNEYVNQVRFQMARTFLENKEYDSVKILAYALGFKDEKNFARNFKKRFGKYPSEYLE
jgi:signal transduction histidine kinase/DNA-binding response OmpR family regulator/phosphotransferase system HPr-like phosphotransfer protein